jgi:hypothetical protein
MTAKERLFVMMEVKERSRDVGCWGRMIYDPVERGDVREVLYLNPKNVIPESMLRLWLKWLRWTLGEKNYETRLILDPEPEEEKDEWEEWRKECPFDFDERIDGNFLLMNEGCNIADLVLWLKRMPGRGHERL